MTPTFDSRGNTKQLQAMKAWADPEITRILYGGAKYGGKSYLGAGLIFSSALTYPGTHWFIARESLNDLRKFTVPTVHEVIRDMGLDFATYIDYNGQDSFFTCYNGSKVFLIETKFRPRDPDFHRFGSIQMTGGWLEEIGEMKDAAIEQLSLTVGRWNNKIYNLIGKVLMTCNPHKGHGFREYYLPFKNGTLAQNKAFIQALPQDNKSGDEAYIQGILNHPIKAIRERLGRGSWEYDDDPTVLVDYDRIIDAYDAEHVPPGPRAITADIAFLGSDKFVIFVWEGWRVIHIQAMAKSDPKVVETTIKLLAEKYEVPRTRVVFDADGIGAYLESYMKNARAFKNGSRPIGKDNFANLKAQAGFFLARKFNQGEIWIMTEDYKEDVVREVEQLKSHNVDNDGKLTLLPKAKIKERIGHSPDFLDCLIMRSLLDLNKTSISSSVPSA